MSNLFSRSSLRANIVTVAMAAFFLAACGGDGNKANEPDPSAEADFVVDSFDDLSVCIDNREGATAYVKNENNAYICTNGDWAIDTNADTRKKSSNSKDNTKLSSSRHCEDCKDEAISSNKDDVKSSSSVRKESSSSFTLNSSSSDISVIEESSSSIGDAGWSWDVPKESRFNPDIIYGTMTDSRDKKVYQTVKIGEQTWMAENLNYADSMKTPSLLERSWCYNNDSANCAVAGRLYTWAAAIDSAKLYNDKSIYCGYRRTCTLPDTVYGICPPGWHLPDTTEWSKLFTAVGGKSSAGKRLKSQTGWNDYKDKSGNGTDAYGFSAFPAGYYNDRFDFEGNLACFWSATENEPSSYYYASNVNLYFSSEGASLNNFDKRDALSVRCLKN